MPSTLGGLSGNAHTQSCRAAGVARQQLAATEHSVRLACWSVAIRHADGLLASAQGDEATSRRAMRDSAPARPPPEEALAQWSPGSLPTELLASSAVVPLFFEILHTLA